MGAVVIVRSLSVWNENAVLEMAPEVQSAESADWTAGHCLLPGGSLMDDVSLVMVLDHHLARRVAVYSSSL